MTPSFDAVTAHQIHDPGASLFGSAFFIAALALVLFVPISLNMVLFHLFLDPASIFPALLILMLNLYLMVVNSEKYKPFLKAR